LLFPAIAAHGEKPEIFKGMAHDMMLEDGWQACGSDK